MNWLALIALAEKYGPTLQWIWKAASSNDDFNSKIETVLPQIATYAVEIATQFFPDTAAAVQKVAGSVLTLNTQFVRYAQQACNVVLKLDPPLEVDGMYGPKTRAAVKQLQTQLGLMADGIFGKVTEAAVQKLQLPGL